MPDQLSEPESAFLAFLRQVWPGGAGYELDGDSDRQTQQDMARLLDYDVIERTEETGVTADGETQVAAVYTLTDEYVHLLASQTGQTPTPWLN